MKLPAGTESGVIANPHDEGLIPYLMAFRGAIEIDTGRGQGFILTENGNLIAAYFRNDTRTYRGKTALEYLMANPSKTPASQQKFVLKAYGDQDFAEALKICTGAGLLVSEKPAEPKLEQRTGISPEMPKSTPTLLDEVTLKKIITLPGVLAVSAFFEGFPVQSLGDANFEHIAALAEDLIRAGTRIAQDMSIGDPDQLILETPTHKFIIVPCGDLFLCIITNGDAQLGLIRVILKSIQSEVYHGS
jgi:predicted regulator of Ras-like GTPase activity (Roadblock/LC7/MglB family)